MLIKYLNLLALEVSLISMHGQNFHSGVKSYTITKSITWLSFGSCKWICWQIFGQFVRCASVPESRVGRVCKGRPVGGGSRHFLLLGRRGEFGGQSWVDDVIRWNRVLRVVAVSMQDRGGPSLPLLPTIQGTLNNLYIWQKSYDNQRGSYRRAPSGSCLFVLVTRKVTISNKKFTCLCNWRMSLLCPLGPKVWGRALTLIGSAWRQQWPTCWGSFWLVTSERYQPPRRSTVQAAINDKPRTLNDSFFNILDISALMTLQWCCQPKRRGNTHFNISNNIGTDQWTKFSTYCFNSDFICH